MSEIMFLSEQIESISRELMNRVSNIIEDQLRMVCEEHGVPPERIILQCYPEGTYSIAVVVSKFKIENEFFTRPEKESICSE